MKFLVIAVSFIFFINQVTSQRRGCRDDCYDYLPANRCGLLRMYCEVSDRITDSCQRTCGKCRSCYVPRVPFQCEEGCRDIYSPLYCHMIKLIKAGCIFASKVCRATCEFCQGCRLPPKELECTNDCADENENCEYWAERDFCDERNGFPHVQVVCPKSCGSCELCSTEEPSTELPPTKEEEENDGDEDTNDEDNDGDMEME